MDSRLSNLGFQIKHMLNLWRIPCKGLFEFFFNFTKSLLNILWWFYWHFLRNKGFQICQSEFGCFFLFSEKVTCKIILTKYHPLRVTYLLNHKLLCIFMGEALVAFFFLIPWRNLLRHCIGKIIESHHKLGTFLVCLSQGWKNWGARGAVPPIF